MVAVQAIGPFDLGLLKISGDASLGAFFMIKKGAGQWAVKVFVHQLIKYRLGIYIVSTAHKMKLFGNIRYMGNLLSID